jgi:hypothetical protein
VSGLLSQAALIVATADLEVVSLITQAMRTADLSGAASQNPPPARPDRIGPAAIVEFRESLRAHCCDRRDYCCPPSDNKPFPPIIYRPARVALRPYIPRATELPHPPSVSPTESPIQPPWKVLPWQNPPPPSQTVKILPHHTDVVQKGMLLDLFV